MKAKVIFIEKKHSILFLKNSNNPKQHLSKDMQHSEHTKNYTGKRNAEILISNAVDISKKVKKPHETNKPIKIRIVTRPSKCASAKSS